MRSRVPPLFALLLAPLATHAHPHAAQQDMLASIVSESQSNGGGPYNVLKCLAVSLAASSLADPTPSAAILPVHQCLGLSERFGFGPFGQAA